MTTGRPPFRAANSLAVLKRVSEEVPRPIREIIPETPEWLCEIISRLHAKNPEARCSSAREVADLLGRRLTKMQQRNSAPDFPIAAGSSDNTPGEQTAAAIPTSEAATSSGRRDPSTARFRSGRRWLVAAAGLLLLFAGLGLSEATGVTRLRGTIVRVFTSEGTLVVDTDDPDVRIAIDGEDVIIAGAGVKELCVKPGQYKVQASKDGKIVSQQLVTVTKNGKQVVRVSREIPPAAKGEIEPKLADPDRKAAEWAASIHGILCLDVVVDGKEIHVGAVNDLPKTPFELRALNVNRNPRVSDEGLAVLKGLQHLTFLQITNTRASDAVLPYIKDSKKLEKLWLYHTRVTDAGLPHLTGFSQLKDLSLKQTKVTEAAVRKLAAALPKCRIVWDGGVIGPTEN